MLLKKEVLPSDSFDIIREIDLVVGQTQSLPEQQKMQPLIALIKETLGKVFFLRHHFTHEELLNHIRSFDEVPEHIQSEIDNLEKKHEELLHKQRESKKNKDFLASLKELNEALRQKHAELQQAREISEQLEDTGIMKRIEHFCMGLSELQFSPEHHEIILTDLLYDFLWILNRFNFQSSLVHYREGNTLVGVPGSPDESLQTLVEKAKKAIEKREKTVADQLYRKALSLYLNLPETEQKTCYTTLFNIWFDLHYHPSVKRMHFNTT